MQRWLTGVGWLILWLMGPAIFLAVEYAGGRTGFPLDDAWIHQTYARSLAGGLGWAYASNPASAGSTSPLWTMLQVPAFWIRISPVVWSTTLGVLLLLATAFLIMQWVRKVNGPASRFAFIFCLGEWHLIWAALSGMETILFCTWIALVFYLFFPMDTQRQMKDGSRLRIILLGVISGLGIWIRPEGILLSGLTLLAVLFQLRSAARSRQFLFLFGVLLPILLYFAFEFSLNGHLLPNTFFVKTEEYSQLTSESLLIRFLQSWVPLLAGPLACLIFFIPPAIWSLVKNRKIVWIIPFLWAIGHLSLYAIQLPATYQHGRYLLPILPVLIGYGVYGYTVLQKKMEAAMASRILFRALCVSAFGLTLVFWGIGSAQFSHDVALIESEMVDVSRWIRDNTPADAVVAAHDIGALGFFGQRRIVDLGGVTDLDAVELLSGRILLLEYLSQKGATLLMTMPDFYPEDLAECIPIPAFPRPLVPEATGSSMQLYDWRIGCIR